jgi:inorganic pyrophosphatase
LIGGLPIGMFQITGQKEGGDKILCVSADNPRQEHLHDIDHLPEFYQLEIWHFFGSYKVLEPGKSVEGTSWASRAEASRRRLRETSG